MRMLWFLCFSFLFFFFLFYNYFIEILAFSPPPRKQGKQYFWIPLCHNNIIEHLASLSLPYQICVDRIVRGSEIVENWEPNELWYYHSSDIKMSHDKSCWRLYSLYFFDKNIYTYLCVLKLQSYCVTRAEYFKTTSF